MTDRDSLLAAVVADPDNPLPRLVFADYLDEAGDPDWAELIRLQNGYFKHWTNAEELKEREAELVERVMANYPQCDGFTLGPPVRGFPERITTLIQSAELIPEQPHVLRQYPITWFDLTGHYPGWLLTGGWLRRAVVVDLSYFLCNTYDDTAFFEAIDPHRLRALIWGTAGLTDNDTSTIVSRPQLAGLRELHLTYNRIGPAGCDALIASPYLSNLEYLDLRGNPVGDAAPRLERRFGRRLCLA